MFLQNKGQELLMKNLYRNFVLHMCNLFDFGLISPVIVYNTIKQLQELLEENGDASKVSNRNLIYWLMHFARYSCISL